MYENVAGARANAEIGVLSPEKARELAAELAALFQIRHGVLQCGVHRAHGFHRQRQSPPAPGSAGPAAVPVQVLAAMR